VERASDGRYYATGTGWRYHPIILFDEDGRFLRTVGGEGAGPGEFSSVNSMAVMPGGGLAIGHSYDKVAVFDRDGRLQSTFQPALGRIRHILPLSDGRFVLVAEKFTAGQPGEEPVVLVTASGERIRALGGPNLFPVGINPPMRLVASGADGTVWVGDEHNYRFEQVDTLARILRVMGVRLAGQRTVMEPLVLGENLVIRKGRPAPEFRPQRLRHAPQRQIDRAYVDSDAILWTVVRIPALNWQEIELRYDTQYSGEQFRTAESILEMYRTQIDAIDTRTGEILARRIVDGYGGLTSDGRVVRSASTEDGYIAVEVFRPVLQRGGH